MRENVRDINSGRTKRDVAPTRELTSRRLAAIVIGDIAGYSRLMESDEEDTHARVRQIQRDLIEPSIVEHHGRLVKTTGDGFVAIFDSPLEAVRCSIVIQQNMVSRNTGLTKVHWIEYRIGVNLGDVIVDEDDVYGDGVNVASRIEGLAEPGQVYISGGIYEQIKNKLVCGYQSLGDRKVKNITDPVKIYRVLPDPAAFKSRKRRTNVLFAAASLLWLGFASAAVWYWLPHLKMQDLTGPTSQSSQRGAVPSVAPMDKQAALQGTPLTQPSTPLAQPSRPVREPEMITLQGGTFEMGSNDDATEKPIHQVTVKRFAMSRYPVSVREWNQCAATKACPFTATGEDDAPVTNVSWDDARQHIAWLTRATGKPYRLPTEAEWEYAARGGTQTRYWWGDELESDMANCRNCATVAIVEQPIKVGSFKPNPFGLYDMGGSVEQWVEDCWHKNYQGAPSDGSAWVESDGCTHHVIRSGSWKSDARYVRPANRESYSNVRYQTHGFRVALSP
jgi:formylglycine-generating enzyme required for sulfatase activity/class 3 adenylate cyclase